MTMTTDGAVTGARRRATLTGLLLFVLGASAHAQAADLVIRIRFQGDCPVSTRAVRGSTEEWCEQDGVRITDAYCLDGNSPTEQVLRWRSHPKKDDNGNITAPAQPFRIVGFLKPVDSSLNSGNGRQVATTTIARETLPSQVKYTIQNATGTCELDPRIILSGEGSEGSGATEGYRYVPADGEES